MQEDCVGKHEVEGTAQSIRDDVEDFRSVTVGAKPLNEAPSPIGPQHTEAVRLEEVGVMAGTAPQLQGLGVWGKQPAKTTQPVKDRAAWRRSGATLYCSIPYS